MDNRKNGIHHQKSNESVEKTVISGMEFSLLASHDGTEVIHHYLSPDSNWAVAPEENWNALEFVYVLTGELLSSDGNLRVKAGESISMAPIKENVFFTTKVGTSFIYVCSKPVYFNYSKVVRDMMDLTVQVEQKDGYTADHCQRIMKLSMLVGEKMNLSPTELYELNLGSFLHDVGKTKVPIKILNKPSSLTSDEWEIMKQHTSFGREVLEKTESPILISAAHIVEQHHERFDGSGYPLGNSGEDIPIGAAIVAVVDSYDAMTTDRVYSKGRSKEEALIEIEKGRGTLYHPDVVDTFLSISSNIE